MNPHTAAVAGAEFLSRAARDGRWSAFHLYPGISDEWVTGYVAATIGEAGAPGADEILATGRRGLAGRQRPDGRYGFNARAIGDADSTLWALRVAALPAGTAGVDVAAAHAALAEHQRPAGIATYAADEPIRTIIEAGPERAMKGWCAPHPCVTAVAAGLATTAPDARAALIDQQQRDGGWPAYWWTDPEYTAGHAAEALAAAGQPAASAAAGRAAAWAASRLHVDGSVRTGRFPNGSAFATALALRALTAGRGPANASAAATAWLCRHLRLDGSWQPSAVLRVPDPDDPDPDASGITRWVPDGRKEGAIVLDRTGVFTTATVVAALTRAAHR
ncbi:hypothetical protein [Pilimelia columellifera]|uniref:Squalene cyclase C-terminal domain-containing protein n=1 Tax=Pilimelia columellifera subsp. columellifera TaxID=706583 RepID=A0ABP6AZM2_9ACTN